MSYSYDAESLREAIRSSATAAAGIDVMQRTSAPYGFTSRSLPSQDAVRTSNKSARRDDNGATGSTARAGNSREETTTYYDSTYRISTPVTPSPPRSTTARGSTTSRAFTNTAAGRSDTNPVTYIICDCGNILKCKMVGPTAHDFGYKCVDCRYFKRKDDVNIIVYTSQTVPPKCRCGKASVERTVTKRNGNKGKKFWGCAFYPEKGNCGFRGWRDENSSSGLSGQKRRASYNISIPTPRTPGYIEFKPDWMKNKILRELINFGFDPTGKRSFWFNDPRQNDVLGHFDLQHAWHIFNPHRARRYRHALERERRKCKRYDNIVTPNFKPKLASLMTRLGNDRLDKTANEVYLFHCTHPKDIHSILFDGLDPTVADTGRFGKGTYFAECAAKADQYAVEDPAEDPKMGTTPENSLYNLHRRLYRTFGDPDTTGVGTFVHSQNVYYMLVCRVILGRPVRTNDGFNQLLHNNSIGPFLFDDLKTRSQLAPFADSVSANGDRSNNHYDTNNDSNNNNEWKIPGSVIAEIGGEAEAKFREFVIFNGDQIFPEYLIAYTRNNRST